MKFLCKLGGHKISHEVEIFETPRGWVISISYPHNQYAVCGRCGEKVKGHHPTLPHIQLGLGE